MRLEGVPAAWVRTPGSGWSWPGTAGPTRVGTVGARSCGHQGAIEVDLLEMRVDRSFAAPEPNGKAKPKNAFLQAHQPQPTGRAQLEHKASVR